MIAELQLFIDVIVIPTLLERFGNQHEPGPAVADAADDGVLASETLCDSDPGSLSAAA